MRAGSTVQHRKHFFRGAIAGLALIIFKFVVFLAVDIADVLYGIVLLLTLLFTLGDILQIDRLVPNERYIDFIVGFLFPLDAYAILILLGVHLTN